MLIAMIDADTRECADRHRELMDQISEKRNVFVFVPKRNIESWLHQLNGNAADEEKDCKPIYTRDHGPAIVVAVKEVLEHTSSSKPTDDLVPSLAFGINTAREIPKISPPSRALSESYRTLARCWRNSSIFTSSVGLFPV